MQVLQEQIPLGRISPTGWKRLRNGSYAYPNMLLDADGNPFTDISFYQAHCIAKKLGFRSIDDSEYNELVRRYLQTEEEMCNYAAWTSFLWDVERAKGGGYSAKHIARPEVRITNGQYFVDGSEKPVKLPPSGFFTVRELMESETGLPTKTYGGKMPDELSAYLWVETGRGFPVLRGSWNIREHRPFNVIATWEPSRQSPRVGVLVVSDSEPTSAKIAGMEAFFAIEGIGQTYNLDPAEVSAVLDERFSH